MMQEHNPPDCDIFSTIRRILCLAKRFAVSVPALDCVSAKKPRPGLGRGLGYQD